MPTNVLLSMKPKISSVLTVHKGKAITFDTSDIERPTLLVP